MMRVLLHRFRLPAAAAALALLTATAVASAATNPTAYTTKGAWTFASAPGLHPPKLRVAQTGAKTSLAPGYFALANFKNILSPRKYTGQGGPLLLDSHLQPVWFLPVNGQYANNLNVQRYKGAPVLTWWEGAITAAGITTKGTDVVYDQSYRQIAAITGQDGWAITQHEMIIAGNDAWVTANKEITVPAGTVPHCPTCTKLVDSAVQEYDLTTKNLVSTWDAYQHIPLTAAEQPASPKAPWDAYHINSIQLVSGGRFLTSMRNTWAAYLVDMATGKIDWTLGGKASSFRFTSANAKFSWQHDVQLHSGGLLTLFDDHCCQLTGNPKSPFVTPTAQSRGLLLRIDTHKFTAGYVHQYVLPGANSARYTAFQGNVDLLADHKVVVGWGSSPFVSEFTFAGKLISDIAFPTPDLSYRGYVVGWTGHPSTKALRAVAVTRKGKTTAYASWNGATQVASWKVLGGSSAKHLHTVATGRRAGFETAFVLSHGYAAYAIVALDSHGHVLATKAFGKGSGSSGSGSGSTGSGGSGPGGY